MKKITKQFFCAVMFFSTAASAQTPFYVTDTKTPASITLEGKPSSLGWWVASRSVTYSDGTSVVSDFKNNLKNSNAAAGHFTPSTPKPASASTQWIAFTLKLTGVVSRNVMDHIAFMGRGTFSGLDPNYDGRGVAMWPDGPSNDYYLGGMRLERFLNPWPTQFPVGAHLAPKKVLPGLKDNYPLKILLHVNEHTSAVWVYDPQDGDRLVDSDGWYTPNYGATTGTGLVFALLCNSGNAQNGLMVKSNCDYREPFGSTNTPYKVEFTNIVVGWF